MSSVKVNITQGTSEWHDWRSKGIGASDVAAIFGLSPYKTKRDLWVEKSGLVESEEPSDDKAFIFRRGHESEQELRELFLKATGIDLVPACFEKDVIFRASLDGYDKGAGILEAKLVGREALKKAQEGQIPEHHRIQIQAQLFTAESDKAFWGGRAPKVKDGVVVEIGRDEKLITKIKVEVEQFWESIQKGKVPELSPADTLFLHDQAVLELAEELKALKFEKDQLDARYKELDEQLKALSPHSKTKIGDLLVLEVERSGSIDYTKIPEIKALKKDYLESFRKKPSLYKTIKFKGV
jgi:putative phage-type endonuclease